MGEEIAGAGKEIITPISRMGAILWSAINYWYAVTLELEVMGTVEGEDTWHDDSHRDGT